MTEPGSHQIYLSRFDLTAEVLGGSAVGLVALGVLLVPVLSREEVDGMLLLAACVCVVVGPWVAYQSWQRQQDPNPVISADARGFRLYAQRRVEEVAWSDVAEILVDPPMSRAVLVINLKPDAPRRVGYKTMEVPGDIALTAYEIRGRARAHGAALTKLWEAHR